MITLIEKIENQEVSSPIRVLLTPQEELLNSYKKFKLLPQFSDPETIQLEDKDYRDVTPIRDPKDLKNGVAYLYVITPDGETWFGPQMSDTTKLTHGGLIRKAMNIPEGMPTPPVLAAGTFMKGKDTKTKEDLAFVNLASGHFEPELTAYTPALEIMLNKLNGYILHAQLGYSTTHFKTLDIRDCREIGLDLVRNNQAFKLDLLTYIYKNHNDMDRSEHVKLVRKIFSEVNVSAQDYDEEKTVEYSNEELDLFFKDTSLAELFDDHNRLFPNAFQNYERKNSINVSF